MFELGRSTGYAIQLLIHLQNPGGESVPVRELAEDLGIPGPYTMKVATRLQEAGLIRSKRGNAGGALLCRPLCEISISDVIAILEGEIPFPKCVLGIQNCTSTTPCPSHQALHSLRDQALAYFRNTSLEDLRSAISRADRYGELSA